MAKRKSKSTYQKTSKIEPSVLTLQFATPSVSPGSAGSSFIDLSQVASIVNRRFYRQGINWAVSGFKFMVGGGFGSVQIQSLPNTWAMSNSWEKVFRAWNRQQKEALEDGNQEDVIARFNDFKIFADSDHLASGFGGNLMPVTTGPGLLPHTALPGEWEASQLVVPNFGAPGVNFEPFLTAVGDRVGGAGGSYSLIQLYEDSRSVPHSPDPDVPAAVLSADNILNLMFDVGDNNTEVMSNAIGKNNDLPYVQDPYPGGKTQLPGLQIHDLCTYTSSTIGGTTYGKGGNFPCGLIKLNHIVSAESIAHNVLVQIDLVPGTHRGYMCEPMTEM